jgi:class 3 adenylate cyclase
MSEDVVGEAERRDLVAMAVEAGASDDEIRRAIDEQTLHTLPVQLGLVAGRERLTVEEAGARAGLDPSFARGVWRALNLSDDDWAGCSERDVPLFTYFGWLRDRMSDDAAFESARVMGASMSQLADSDIAQIRARLEAPLRRSGGGNVEVARLLLEMLDAIPLLQQAILVAHRRHLHASGRRYSLWGVRPSEASTTECVVGFADIVGFTSLGEQLDAEQLDALLRAFEQRVTHAATSTRTRLVKLIGDAALFVAGTGEEAVGIASALLRDPDLPQLRVGLAAGEVVTRGGDIYGSVVNLASRLVNTAEPGQILADTRTVDQLDAGARVRSLGLRDLVGFERPAEVFAVSPRPPTS